jgi:dephospho-CoA kinase
LVSTVLRQSFGEDLLAKAIAKDAQNLEADIVVIDGVRRLADIKYLNELENFYLISIDADPQIRFKRLVERNENEGDKDKTYKQFLADHEAEADRQIPLVMPMAKFKIDNSGDRESFYAQIDDIIKKITTS